MSCITRRTLSPFALPICGAPRPHCVPFKAKSPLAAGSKGKTRSEDMETHLFAEPRQSYGPTRPCSTEVSRARGVDHDGAGLSRVRLDSSGAALRSVEFQLEGLDQKHRHLAARAGGVGAVGSPAASPGDAFVVQPLDPVGEKARAGDVRKHFVADGRREARTVLRLQEKDGHLCTGHRALGAVVRAAPTPSRD